MKLGQKTKYALLFVLYLGRAGRARTTDAAHNLGLSVTFMEQVARKLRVGGIVKSIRGPGGGYELAGNPSIGEVLDAMKVSPLMTKEETQALSTGTVEQRALGEIVGRLAFNLTPVLKASVTAHGAALSAAEGKQLGSLSEASVQQ